MNEIWKDIQGYEEYYQISNSGRVKIKQRQYITKVGVTKIVKEKYITPNSGGYIMLRRHPYHIDNLMYTHFPQEYLHRFLAKTSLPNELWKDIPGYEGLYQISTLGRVRSLPRKDLTIQNIKRVRNGKEEIFERIAASRGRILKPLKIGSPDKKGLYRLGVRLSKGGEPRQFLINRLVAEAFIPNPLGLPEVNHKNRNILDNSIDNLEWISSIDNKEHSHIDRESLIKLYKLAYKENVSPSELLSNLVEFYKEKREKA